MKERYIKFMLGLTASLIYGAAFTFGQWYATELIKEREKRERLDEIKQQRLAEIRQRRADMGLSNN